MVEHRWPGAILAMVLFCLPLFASPPLQAAELSARIVEPAGFIAPGAFESVVVELRNPSDSGRTIERIEPGSRMQLINGQPDARTRDLISPAGDCAESVCLQDGSLPVLPGETVRFVLWRLWADPALAVQSRIRLSRLHLRLFEPGNEGILPSLDLHLENDLVRIVVPDGQGGEALPGEIDTDNPLAGVSGTQAEVELILPESVPAGQHFEVVARLRNTGEATVGSIHFIDGFRAGGGEGAHAGSFRFRRCPRNCRLTGTDMLAPGAETTIVVGTFFYTGSTLFDGEFRPAPPALIISDTLGRNSYPPIDPPAAVMVEHPRPVSDNPAVTLIPERQSLQLRDLRSPGDALLVHDPNTGYDWLRLGETVGLTPVQVRGELSPGGRFDGFRIASTSQVRTLLLNHLHASGVAARAFDLGSRPPAAVRGRLFELMQGLPVTDSRLGQQSARGFVSDPPPFEPAAEGGWTLLSLSIRPDSGGFVATSQGLSTRVVPASGLDGYTEFSGTWLVRTGQAEPERPADRVSFHQDILVLPDVLADGVHYRVSLAADNLLLNRLRLVDLAVRERSASPLVFDTRSGILDIENAVLLLPDGTGQHYDLRLRHLPGSEPAVFQVTRLVRR